MADLTFAEPTANRCCAPEQQTSCCEPSAKADCCGHAQGCSCYAGGDTDPAGDVPEQVREVCAAAIVRTHKPAPAA